MPAAHSYAQRLAALRTLLLTDPGDAGDQALKLLEEYLETMAHQYGYADEGSLRRYAMFLRGRTALSDELLDRVDTYTDARNCLAHTYGLQTTPEFATEVIDFIGVILKQSGLVAAQLMTEDVQTIGANEPLTHARDLMLRGGYGRLPALQASGRILGVLTERDVVAAQLQAEQSGKSLAGLTVADALADTTETNAICIAPNTPREQIVELMRKPGIIACLVTPDGSLNRRPVGIITHADLLYRT